MKKLFFVLFCLGLITSQATFVCAEVDEILAEANCRFAIDLYAKLNAGDKNLFFSPYSISTALAMTYAGAKGETASQMSEVLHFGLIKGNLHEAFANMMKDINAIGEHGGCKLSVANALWGQKGYPFVESFIALNKKYYDAGLNNVDFRKPEKASNIINKWASEKTNNKIDEIISPQDLRGPVRLILTNAIYFMDKWDHQFKEKNTKDKPFHLIGASQVDVSMMNQERAFQYAEDKDVQILEMIYTDLRISMVIFLPKKNDGIKQLEKNFTYDNVKRWLSMLKEEKVDVYFPRFKTESTFSLKNTLQALGMKAAFVLGQADFSGISTIEDGFIGEVLHKTYINVDEEGTEAAAVTAILWCGLSMMPEKEKIVFKADHPFIYIIRDKVTKNILFCGRLMNPR